VKCAVSCEAACVHGERVYGSARSSGTKMRSKRKGN